MYDKINEEIFEACPEDTKNAHRHLLGKPEEEKALEKYRFK
jgi:hypothetical protein